MISQEETSLRFREGGARNLALDNPLWVYVDTWKVFLVTKFACVLGDVNMRILIKLMEPIRIMERCSRITPH